MDINYLLRREQVSLINARRATGSQARHVHRALARAYGARLAATAYPHRCPMPANDTADMGKSVVSAVPGQPGIIERALQLARNGPCDGAGRDHPPAEPRAIFGGAAAYGRAVAAPSVDPAVYRAAPA